MSEFIKMVNEESDLTKLKTKIHTKVTVIEIMLGQIILMANTNITKSF